MKSTKPTVIPDILLAVPCARRGYRIELPVCCRMQTLERRRCEAVGRGVGCEWLDSNRIIGEPEFVIPQLVPVEAVVEQIRDVWSQWI